MPEDRMEDDSHICYLALVYLPDGKQHRYVRAWKQDACAPLAILTIGSLSFVAYYDHFEVAWKAYRAFYQ